MVTRTELARVRRKKAERDGKRIPRDELARVVDLMRRTVPRTPAHEEDAKRCALELGGWWASPSNIQRYHEAQARAFFTEASEVWIEAGRGSGKTNHGKRLAVIAALDPDFPLPSRYIVCGGPTDDQTVGIWWDGIKDASPKRYVVGAPKESTHEIRYCTGALTRVAGLDKPQRVEGRGDGAIDFLFVDESADVKPEAWKSHLKPMLTRPNRPRGKARLTSVPDMKTGRWFQDGCDSVASMARENPDYLYMHWTGESLIDPEIWAEARRTMSKAEFEVEMLALRVTTANRVYYEFDRHIHVQPLRVIPSRPAILCFDFNVEPGVAAILQEQTREDYPGRDDWPEGLGDKFTAIVDEVWIPHESSTPRVVRKVFEKLDGHKHTGKLHLYGDPSGGNRGAVQLEGSDWDVIKRMVRKKVGQSGYSFFVPSKHPPVRMRVNTANRRLMMGDGTIRLLVDPSCAHCIDDLERVALLEGGSGEIYKPTKGPGSELTHLSDAFTYYLAEAYGRKGKTVFRTWAG